MIIREMTIDDYDEVYEMWQITTKRALSKADEKDQMERYLKHNAGMSQVAVVDGKIVGTVLAGHDGRRGFKQLACSAYACLNLIDNNENIVVVAILNKFFYIFGIENIYTALALNEFKHYCAGFV